MLQWLGGIGIIVMAITLMPIMNIGGMQLFVISTSNTPEKILPKSKEVSIRLILVYVVLTIVCSIFYKIFGMGFFDSIVHSMTTIATGGFSNYNESIGYFDSALIELTSIVFIILGSIPFIAYIKYLNGDKKIFLNDTQIKTFFKIIIFSIFLMFIFLSIKNQSIFQINLREVAFNVIFKDNIKVFPPATTLLTSSPPSVDLTQKLIVRGIPQSIILFSYCVWCLFSNVCKFKC